VVDSTPPDPPTNVFLDLLVVTTGRLHANWTASTSSDVVGYEYKVQSEPNGAQSFSDLTAWAPTTGTDVKVSGLPLNITTHYRVCVRSKDAVGNYCTMAVSSSLLPNYGSFEYYYGYCVRNTADANVSNVYKQIDAGLWDIYHWNWTGVSGGCSVYGSPNYFGKSSQTWSSQTTADVLADFNQYNTIIFFCPDAPIEEKVEAAIEQFLGGFQKRLVLIGNAYGANHNPIVQLYSLNYNLNGLLQYLGCSTRFDYTDHPYPSGTFCVTPVSHYLTVQGSSPYTVTQLCGMEAGYLTGNNHTIAMRPVPDGCVWVCEEDIVNGGSIICIADSDSFSPSFGPDSTHNTSSWWASQHYGDARFLANLFSRFNR